MGVYNYDFRGQTIAHPDDDLTEEEKRLIKDAQNSKGDWTVGGSAVGTALGAVAGGLIGGLPTAGAGAIPGAGLGAGLGGTLGGWVGSMIGGAVGDNAQKELDEIKKRQAEELAKEEEALRKKDRSTDLLSPFLSNIRGMV